MVVKVKKKLKVKNKGNVCHNGSGRRLTELLGDAIQLHQSGDLVTAGKMYREILRDDPEHADALHLTGVIAHQTGNNILAVEYLDRAISIFPSVPYYHNNRGNALLNLGRVEEAVESFQKAIDLKPDYFEAYNNLGNAFKKQGEIDKAIQQFKTSIHLNGDYEIAHNNLANLFKDEGRFDEAIIHYQKAAALNPNSAEVCYNFGTALREVDRADDAVVQLRRAISINPDFADAHNNLANILKDQRMLDDALIHYKKAVALKTDFAEAHNNLGDLYRRMGCFHEAVQHCRKALNLSVNDERFYLTLGNIFLEKADFGEAITQYDKAIDLKPDFADAHYTKGLVLLMKGEFDSGWKEYEWRFMSREISKNIGYRYHEIPAWDGSSLDGKTIFIVTEQGLGDHIQFLRYIPLIKRAGGRVVFECRSELRRLFERYDGIDLLWDESAGRISEINPDVCVQLLNLPLLFGTTLDTIIADVPYLTAETAIINKWKAHMNQDLFNVGLVWSGNPSHKNDHNRSCKLSDFAPLSAVPGVAFYSLQKGGIGGNGSKPPSGMKIEDLGKDISDFYDTAGIIENLDLVISVDTAVVHLAGAMGKPVWTLLPFIPDWRWMLDRSDSPWYPTMRLFRQRGRKDWARVMHTVAAELEKVLLKGASYE